LDRAGGPRPARLGWVVSRVDHGAERYSQASSAGSGAR
jgi:hypothetical protein